MKLITLENGLRVFFNPNDSLRSAIAGVWVASGSRYENEKNNGISHFTEHIVFKGSNTRSGFEIAEGMDEIGAYVNAYTTKEYTFYYTKALDYQIEKAADILFDMITNPRLDENDIETEKGVILEEISMCEDDPSDVCYEINEKSIFSQSGLAFEILGSRESVQNLKKEDFLSYLSQIYLPERTVIGIGGKYDEEAMLKKVKEYLSYVPEIHSWDAPAGEDGSVQDLLEDLQAPQPQEELVRRELERTMEALLGQLDDRQRLLVRLRFGMEDDVCHSLEDIGNQLGVSKERARQLEQQTIKKLKQLSAGLGLEDFLN